MRDTCPRLYPARHGETAWTVTRQPTGLTDSPRTERGEANARRLGLRLAGIPFARVSRSPLQRAVRTCELAGFAAAAELDRDLVEWNYGQCEGRLTPDILRERPHWQLFRDGCPGGKSPPQAAERAHRVANRVRAAAGNVLLFSSRHLLNAQALMLSRASVSASSYENSLSRPAVLPANDTHPVLPPDEPKHPNVCEREASTAAT